MCIYLLEPIIKVQKALLIEKIKNQDDSVGSLIICICDSFIAFLACSVPDLELNLAPVVSQRSESKVNANRGYIVLIKLIV